MPCLFAKTILHCQARFAKSYSIMTASAPVLAHASCAAKKPQLCAETPDGSSGAGSRRHRPSRTAGWTAWAPHTYLPRPRYRSTRIDPYKAHERHAPVGANQRYKTASSARGVHIGNTQRILLQVGNSLCLHNGRCPEVAGPAAAASGPSTTVPANRIHRLHPACRPALRVDAPATGRLHCHDVHHQRFCCMASRQASAVCSGDSWASAAHAAGTSSTTVRNRVTNRRIGIDAPSIIGHIFAGLPDSP